MTVFEAEIGADGALRLVLPDIAGRIRSIAPVTRPAAPGCPELLQVQLTAAEARALLGVLVAETVEAAP